MIGSLNIRELLQAYREKKIKPVEVIQYYLNRIQEKNKKLNAVLEVRPEESLKKAKELETKLDSASSLSLFGVPIVIKDNILVQGWKATAGSKILNNYFAPYSATSFEKLERQGAIIVGKANCDEFAMGSSNENSAFGPVKNPHDLSRVPGGSSGGSAVSVSSRFCLGALGTDTGGSIRQPASLCGIVGLKPSYGRVSRYGVIAYASSLDQVGPFAQTVWDTARLFEVMAGHDPNDATTSSMAIPSFTEHFKNPIRGMKLGVAEDWLKGLDDEIYKNFKSSLCLLENEGVKIIPIKLPHTKYALSTYYLVATSEASSNLARYDGVHYGYRTQTPQNDNDLYFKSRGEGFGREVKLRIMLGTYALSSGYYDAFYLKANQVRRLIQKDFEDAFKVCDCIASPTSPSTAFKIGEKVDDPITMYLSDIFTLPVNLAGLPGISVPSGMDSKSLPIGLQLIGRPFDEATLFSIANHFEMVRGPFPLPVDESTA